MPPFPSPLPNLSPSTKDEETRSTFSYFYMKVDKKKFKNSRSIQIMTYLYLKSTLKFGIIQNFRRTSKNEKLLKIILGVRLKNIN